MQNENPAIETVSSGNFLDQLRAATLHSHRQLEQIPISTVLIRPALTQARYFEYLSLMRDITADAELRIFPQLTNHIPDLPARLKTALLDSDLALAAIKPATMCAPLSANGPFSDAFAMGIFYVIEGSTLGGRYILNNVRETLARDQNNGAAYFYGYGNQTGAYWKKFLDTLITFEARHQNREAVIAGAVFAFESIHRHFSQKAQHEN